MNKTILFVVSFFAANAAWAQQASTAAPKTIKLADDEIEIGGDKIKRSALYGSPGGAVLESHEVKGMDAAGQPEEKLVERKAFGSTGADYVVRSHSVLSGWGDEEPGSYEKSIFELFDKNGSKLFEKELGNRKIEQTWIFKNGASVLFTDENIAFPMHVNRYQIYDRSGNLLNEITSTAGMGAWQIAEYKIANGINIDRFIMFPQADAGFFLVRISDTVGKIIKLDTNGKLSEIASYTAESLGVNFLKGIEMFLVFATNTIDKLAPSGQHYESQTIYFYKDFKLIWKTSIEVESFGMFARSFSKTGRYIIVEYWKDIVMKGNAYGKFAEWVKVVNTANGKVVYDGDKLSEKTKKYAAELVAE